MTTSAVQVRNLRVEFGTDRGPVTAVSGISFDVGPAEILAIVGESGSGKSMTARSIMRLLPDAATMSGEIRVGSRDGLVEVFGLDREALRRARGRDFAMVFQEPATALNPVFTIGWQMAQGLRAHRAISRREAHALCVAALAEVGIPDPEVRIKHYPHQFSGGQKQRIIIAMALMLEPALIIADEPTTALDVTMQQEILDLLRRSRDEHGSAIVLITHSMGVVADMADRVLVMHSGTVVEEAETVRLFEHPEASYTRQLLESVPRIGTEGTTDRRRRMAPDAEAPGGPMVEAVDLQVTYRGGFGASDFTAVDGVSLSIEPGQVVGLVGESGSGKSTVGRAIAGLSRVSGGSLTVLGADMSRVTSAGLREVRRKIGYVFQDPASSFNPLCTIGDSISEPLVSNAQDLNDRQIVKRLNDLLNAVQLPRDFARRFPHELSGGQRQRASLARALALEPELLIADEPTSALDVSVQAKVLEMFAELQAEHGFACLFISHDLAVIDQVSDRIAVMRAGKLVEDGDADDVLKDPRSAYTAALIDASPVPDPVVQRNRRQGSAR